MMDKEQFVKKVADRLNVAPSVVEASVDATLAEVLTPAVFAPAEKRLETLFCNNCNNNCCAEVAARIPSRS